VVGIESYPLRLDPRYSTDANSVRVGHLIYDSLLRSDERSVLRRQLAEDWRMLDDRTYLFELRKDVKFHDGRPLTAADVKFTYESILSPDSLSPKRGPLKPLRAVEQSGAYQLRFHLHGAHAPFVEQLRANQRLSGALAAITAAVVGVILNLTVWFALHVLFGKVEEARAGPLRWYAFDPLALDLTVLALALIAVLLAFTLRRGLVELVLTMAALGVAVRLFLGA